MKVLIFGSRSLTWRHLPVMRAIATHSLHYKPPPLDVWLANNGVMTWDLSATASCTLLNGDGPPGKERGAVGADKLALLAAMETWPEAQRRVRWFPPEPKDGETWAQAAGRRNREMVEAKPDRAYCVHTCLEQSKGSSMTARLLTEAGSPYWYVRVAQSGELIDVAEMRP